MPTTAVCGAVGLRRRPQSVAKFGGPELQFLVHTRTHGLAKEVYSVLTSFATSCVRVCTKNGNSHVLSLVYTSTEL